MTTTVLDDLATHLRETPGAGADGVTQNDVLWSSPGPGIVYKGGLKVHFGGA